MQYILLGFIITLAVVAPISAQAGVRDDVMSSAYRCVSIDDTRQWLNCYYGSAQLARAQLGLSPAPAEQIRMAMAPPRGGKPKDVRIRDGVMAEASSCYTIGDDRKWLDCYYGAAQPIRAELGLSAAPQANAVSMSRNADQPVSARSIGDIVSRMASYSFDSYGIFTVTLTNGQVWRQLSGDTTYAHWNKAPGDYLVNIRSGFLGSRKFEVQGTVGAFRVRQIK